MPYLNGNCKFSYFSIQNCITFFDILSSLTYCVFVGVIFPNNHDLRVRLATANGKGDSMRILVIDDKAQNTKAARAQLSAHDLTLASSYDEAVKRLGGSYEEHDFDVVLTDLMMPASGDCMGEEGEQFVGKDMPVGIFLVLLAAKRGAKRVALLSDTDHHDHPASASLDLLNGFSREPAPFRINSTLVLLTNNSDWIHWDAATGRTKDWGGLLKHLLTLPE